MNPDPVTGVTQILHDLSRGEADAPEKLLPLVYNELRRLAAAYFSSERKDHTLQPTALVHEAYLRLVDGTNIEWNDRTHFFGFAARVMRQILIDHARHYSSQKHGGGNTQIVLDDAVSFSQKENLDLLALDEALRELSQLDEQQSRIVELRFFGGLTLQETAEVLNISTATVKREWTTAKAWLHSQLFE